MHCMIMVEQTMLCYFSWARCTVVTLAGYKNSAWLAGGFNKAVSKDFPQVEGSTKLQYSTIGGAFLQLLFILRVLDKES